jgi:hypothetical protein
MKATLNISNNICGTSWFGLILTTTPNDIIKALGTPHYEDYWVEEKTSMEWHFETEDGVVFTIYDWKEYAFPAAEHYNRVYNFHIGLKNYEDSSRVIEILKEYGLNATLR